jgi:hypothetical protein
MDQKNLMYLVKDLDQVHSLLLTNFYLYFGIEGVYIVTEFESKSFYLSNLRLKFLVIKLFEKN